MKCLVFFSPVVTTSALTLVGLKWSQTNSAQNISLQPGHCGFILRSGYFFVHCTLYICTCRSPKLREQAIQVLRDLLAGHDSDLRYNNAEARAKIASIYLPLLSIVMDNYQLLYKGADGWEDWTTTFERNTSVRRSVVIRSDSVDGSLEIEQVQYM